MTREDISKDVLEINNNNILLELATSVGKSKIALDWLRNKKLSKILIVVPRIVLIENWIDEIKKWHYDDMFDKITFSTYVSLQKHKGDWDAIIFDETQHLSKRCRQFVDDVKSKYTMFLSATVTKEMKDYLIWKFRVTVYKVSARNAIDNNILPDPVVIFMPISFSSLDNFRLVLLLISISSV